MTEKKKSDGGIWVKQSKNGNEFFSLTVELNGSKHKFVAFKNNYKQEGSNQPDYKLYISEPLQPQQAPTSLTQRFATPPLTDEDVPF